MARDEVDRFRPAFRLEDEGVRDTGVERSYALECTSNMYGTSTKARRERVRLCRVFRRIVDGKAELR